MRPGGALLDGVALCHVLASVTLPAGLTMVLSCMCGSSFLRTNQPQCSIRNLSSNSSKFVRRYGRDQCQECSAPKTSCMAVETRKTCVLSGRVTFCVSLLDLLQQRHLQEKLVTFEDGTPARVESSLTPLHVMRRFGKLRY